MKPSVQPRSYRDVPPREYGGENARNGFAFQDHIAAKYCLEMMLGNKISEVWCETLDDITLVNTHDQGEMFEFVQVKSNNLGKHWSVAELCSRDAGKDSSGKNIKVPGTSILEKSLTNNAADEPCRFRIVTTCSVDKNLEILQLPLLSPKRVSKDADMIDLTQLVSKYSSGYKSDKGNEYDFWLENTVWSVEHSEEHVENKNLLQLELLLGYLGETVFLDQRKELYYQLLGKVFHAAKSRYNVDPIQKRITRQDCINWLRDAIYKAQNPSISGSGANLERKLTEGRLDSYVVDAQRQRRKYLTRRRTQAYLDTFDNDGVEMEAELALTKLKLDLDTGTLPSGPIFLGSCINRLEKIGEQYAPQVSGITPYLTGYMYDLADRCVFRFKKAGA